MRLAALAARQHGVVSWWQLQAMEVTKAAVEHRLRVKRLHRVFRGVYAVGRADLTYRGRYLAAVLACGEGALLSHRSAADLWDLRKSDSRRVEVTVGGGRHGRRPGIQTHRTRYLPKEHIAACDGIPCTASARTLVDLAGVVSASQLQRALERSLTLDLFDGTAIAKALRPGRRGTGTLRRLLTQLNQPPPTRNELERRFLDIARSVHLPDPQINVPIGSYVVDSYWPDAGVVVETDGAETHANPFAFQRDRRRDLDLELAGLHVMRLGWRQVFYEPGRVGTALLRRYRQLVVAAGKAEREHDPVGGLLHRHRQAV